MAWVLVLVGLSLGWWCHLRPAALGGPVSLMIVSGESMLPGMESGDLAILRESPSYDVGDVVGFEVASAAGESTGSMVIHRIVDQVDGTFITRGDNNDWNDPWDPSPDAVTGRLWATVGDAGSVLTVLRQPVLLGAVLSAVVTFMVLAKGDPKASSGEEGEGEPEEQAPSAQGANDDPANAAGRRHRAGVAMLALMVLMIVLVRPGAAARLAVDAAPLQTVVRSCGAADLGWCGARPEPLSHPPPSRSLGGR